VNAYTHQTVLSTTDYTCDHSWLLDFNLLFLNLLWSIQRAIDKHAVLLMFWQLLIKELPFAVIALYHSFGSIILSSPLIESLNFLIIPFYFAFDELLLFLAELWRFSSI
jgi:hypothetical protein